MALPLGDKREALFFDKFSEVTRATIKGSLLVAMVQGLLGGFIFWALGIGAPLLWGVIMTLLSLVPMIGAGLVWLPVALYLFAIGDFTSAIILVGFGVAVIGLVDNILRPILVGRDTKLPDYLVLLSTLGGFTVFGMNGFVIGPLIAALFVTCWNIFIKEFNFEKDRLVDAQQENAPVVFILAEDTDIEVNIETNNSTDENNKKEKKISPKENNSGKIKNPRTK
jgi:predicted PurR-regulated permease PerM